MPRYNFLAKVRPGEIIDGDLEAESEEDAIAKLTRKGYFPVSVKPEDFALPAGIFYFRKVSRRDIVLFTRQLASLVESGVNILNSLNLISEQAINPRLKSILKDIIGKVKDGKPLSESMGRHERVFSTLYTSMIRSGEASGNLEKVLKGLAEFQEKDEDFRSAIRAALTYPAFVFSVGVLTVAVLLGFVIPRLIIMFEDMGQALPLPTLMLIKISGFLRSFGWLFLSIGTLGIFLFHRLIKTAEGRFLWDKFRLKVKILGTVIIKSEISRMCRTMSLLLSSGITIVSSLDVTCSVLTNEVLRQELKKIKEKIIKGASLSKGLQESAIFPKFAVDIVAVGEETGAVEKALARIAENYEKDVDRYLKEATRLLEPIVILTIGLVVGFIVIAMLLPVFQINLMVR